MLVEENNIHKYSFLDLFLHFYFVSMHKSKIFSHKEFMVSKSVTDKDGKVVLYVVNKACLSGWISGSDYEGKWVSCISGTG